MYSLEELGWQKTGLPPTGGIPEGLIPGRIAQEHRGAYVMFTEAGALEAVVTGRLMHEATSREEYPAVGDWVLARPIPGEARAIVQELLPRRTKLSRKEAGERTGEQIIAANVDVVFLCASLNHELNERRIERYLAVAWEAGALPVVVLNKSDLADDAMSLAERVRRSAPGVDVYMTSAQTGEGVEALRAHLGEGVTTVFVGSSGVGKSSLINRLADAETQAVKGIRQDDKGRHTTTSRQMILLPGGGLIIDTPGLREIQLWDAAEGISQAFSDLDGLAAQCGFRDCTHSGEPGCAVISALDEGRLDRRRFESFRKLQREQEYVDSKKDASLRLAKKNKWKAINKSYRQRMKMQGR